MFQGPGPTWKPVSPISALGAGALRWLKSLQHPSLMEPGELCRSGGEPGARANMCACPWAPARGWPAVPAVFPGGLAALCSFPAALGPVGNWGRGEQMFLITERLAGKEAARLRGLRAGSASRSRVRFCPGAFLNKQDVSAAKTSSSDAEEEGRSGG